MGWEEVGAKTEGEKSGVRFTKIATGKTVLRILDEAPISQWKHWVPALSRSISCLGNGCPICNDMKEKKQNNGKSLFTSIRTHTINVWNYATEQVEILEKGNSIFEQIKTLNFEVGDVREYDITIVRKGEGRLDTTYMVMPGTKSKLPEEILAKEKYDLAKFRELMTVEQVQEIVRAAYA